MSLFLQDVVLSNGNILYCCFTAQLAYLGNNTH